MPPPVRPLNEIIAQLRAVAANPNIDTTLIQTQDLEALCDAAEHNEAWRSALLFYANEDNYGHIAPIQDVDQGEIARHALEQTAKGG